jgi:hypothetical protein
MLGLVCPSSQFGFVSLPNTLVFIKICGSLLGALEGQLRYLGPDLIVPRVFFLHAGEKRSSDQVSNRL